MGTTYKDMGYKTLLIKYVSIAYRLNTKKTIDSDDVKYLREKLDNLEIEGSMNEEIPHQKAQLYIIIDMLLTRPDGDSMSISTVNKMIDDINISDVDFVYSLKRSLKGDADEDSIDKQLAADRSYIDRIESIERTRTMLGKHFGKITHRPETVHNIGDFIADIQNDMEELGIGGGYDNPAVKSRVSFNDIDSVLSGYAKSVDSINNSAVYKLGIDVINTALQGGLRTGLSLISALQGENKTGLMQTMLTQIPKFNKAPECKDGLKPTILYVVLEDQMNNVLLGLFKNIKHEETREVVNLKDYSFKEMGTYVKSKMETNGWGFEIVKANPSDWTLADFIGFHRMLKGEGKEVKIAAIDYISLMNKSGCTHASGGSEFRDIHRRMKAFGDHHDIAMLSPCQLGPKVKRKLEEGTEATALLQDIKGLGLNSDSTQIIQELDISMISKLIKYKKRTLMHIVVDKHRHHSNIPDSDKNFYLLFPEDGQPIPSDVDNETKVGGRTISELFRNLDTDGGDGYDEFTADLPF